MMIRVVYQNFKCDFVKPFRLDEFIDSGRISMFKRSSGWVFVGIDPIRKKKKPYLHPYQWTERRRSGQGSQQ